MLMKRLFDIGFSIFGILVSSPVMIVCGLLVKFTSSGPVLFRQIRMGRNFKPFNTLKFRTMYVESEKQGAGALVTVDGDSRITPVGRILRKTKLDEFPQLFNVLMGDMSFVGPRPEVQKFVEMFSEDYKTLLSVRPGITGLASIEFRHEEEILAAADNPGEEYVNKVLPEKIKLGKKYVEHASVWLDIKLIIKTLLSIVSAPQKPKVPA